MRRVLIRVDGRVQGVGFRWWIAGVADDLGLVGYAENLPDGRVEILAQGEPAALGRLIERLLRTPSATRPGRIDSHTIDWSDPDPALRGFRCR